MARLRQRLADGNVAMLYDVPFGFTLAEPVAPNATDSSHCDSIL